MNAFHNYIQVAGGRLMDLSKPQVMGILNCTPDSFYPASRMQDEDAIAARVREITGQGGTIIDVGACSTRPNSEPTDEKTETERLRWSLPIIMRECQGTIVSVDTFRPEVARMAVEEYGVSIVNDISGGSDEMFAMVARLGTPYILTSQAPDINSMIIDLTDKIRQLRSLGQKDIIIDPGFGFGKNIDENYGILRNMEMLHSLGLPLLVGVSRKRMVYTTLGTTPNEALNGTTVVNTIALMKGCNILRVHDVTEAVEAVKITNKL